MDSFLPKQEIKCNFKKGKLIESIDELMTWNIVYVERWGRVSPVAFLQNWQCRLIYRWINLKQFYVAIPKEN
jgi:hypothetical protein